MSDQGRKKLAAEQFNRALEIMHELNGYVFPFPHDRGPRLHVKAADAIRERLAREYRLGMAAQRRKRTR